jgi:hypothetical protein
LVKTKRNDVSFKKKRTFLFKRNGFGSLPLGAFLLFFIIIFIYKLKLKLKKLIYWNRVKKSIEIQRVIRGFQSRKKTKIKFVLHKNLKIKKEKNAILIQKIVRG